jgi:DNA-binding PadR family transcriptional regulator
MSRNPAHPLLLGEWACLGILYTAPAHGFAVAARLKPIGDIGRVWSLSRPLTYRALDQLTARGFVRPIAEEPGIAGGNRTILAATRAGRSNLRTWLTTPVEHLRDLRSELLLKLVLAERCDVDLGAMLVRQRALIAATADRLELASADDPADVVARWRSESSRAALRFLDAVTDVSHAGAGPGATLAGDSHVRLT